MKRTIALTLIFALALTLPLQALAAQDAPVSGAYEITFHMEPDYFSRERQSLMSGLADGLNVIALKGQLTALGLEKFLITGDVLVNGNGGVNYQLKGSERWIAVNSNLLGDETAVLMMLVWLEFWMKPYNFLEVPTQYPALLTSTYAHKSAWQPVIDLWNQYFAGEGSRSYSTEYCMEAAQAISAHVEGSREIITWLLALMGELGADGPCYDSLITLPDYVAEYAGNTGITVACEEDTETWYLGEEAFFLKKLDKGGWSWRFTPPARDGYTASAEWTYSDGGADGLDIGFQALVTSREEESPVFTLNASASGLPNGQKKEGGAEAFLDMGGSILGDGISAAFAGQWLDTRKEDGSGALNASLSLLDNAARQPKLTITIDFVPNEAQDDLDFTDAEIEASGDNVFTFYEETLADFVNRIKLPAAKAFMPMMLSLPASFLNEVLQWLEETGFVNLVLPSE